MIERADYKYYTDSYGGTVLDEAVFSRNIGLVYEIIAHMTMQRIRTQEIDEDVSERIKTAACAAAEAHAAESAREGIVSENNDGYSVTYSDKRKTAQGAAEDIIKIYLADTGLLYRGNA